MAHKPKTILLIPDAHAHKEDKLHRFKALHTWLASNSGRLDGIVNIGDNWDFESLCTHDMNDPAWNERSLEDDINAGFDALDHQISIANTMDCPLDQFYFVEGNHEDRYRKWMKSDNRLRKSAFPKDIIQLIRERRKTVPIKTVSFLKPLKLYGAIFSHYFVSGLMGRPQGGEHHANNLLRSQHTSCICGHSHLLSTSTRTRADGSKIHALVGGCFVDPKAEFAYARAAKKLWWNGAHLLHFYAPGEFDVESISLGRLSH